MNVKLYLQWWGDSLCFVIEYGPIHCHYISTLFFTVTESGGRGEQKVCSGNGFAMWQLKGANYSSTSFMLYSLPARNFKQFLLSSHGISVATAEHPLNAELQIQLIVEIQCFTDEVNEENYFLVFSPQTVKG